MSPVDVAAVYSSLLIILGVGLQVRVITRRRSRRIGVGFADDRDLERVVRVHGNFVENAVFGIATLILLALTLAPLPILHVCGLLMLVGRLAHAYGLSQTAGSSVGRVAGMIMTFTSLLVAAGTLLVRALV